MRRITPVFTCLAWVATMAACSAATTLWQIGKADNDTAEFAHAPKNYTAYREPAFFIPGVSDPKRDWPYVQPGTIDGGWAPGTPQTYDVLFGLKAVPAGECRLVIDFTDTHSTDPPKLLVTVNDRSWEYQTPKGAGDASVFGEPAKGREHVIEVTVPAGALRAGDNRVSITTLNGSWVLWDALRFDVPRGTEMVEVKSRTIVRSVSTQPVLVRNEGQDVQGIALEFMRVGGKDEKKVFVEACRNGQIHLDVLYAQAMTGMYSEEELFELLSAAKRFEKQYGARVVSAMQSDVPGYTWGLAAALAHHDVPYLSVGPNWFANGGAGDYFRGDKIVGRTHRGGRVFRWADMPFWWVSPSGKHRVFFWMPGWGYSGFHGNRGAITRDKIMSYLGHLERKGYPYDIVMWRYGIGADNGPPSRALPDVVKAWNEKYASPRLIIARNSDVLKKFAERYGDEIPVLRGDYTPYWEDGSASTAKATGANREAAEKLAQAQVLWSMLNPSLKLHERVDVAWNKMVMYDEHTWGAHCSISQPDSPFSIRQDEYKQAYAFDAFTLTDKLVADVVENGRGAIDVYNTLSWARSELVTLPASESDDRDLVKDDKGKPVPSQRLASGELAFMAKGVSAFGGRRYTLHAGKPHAAGAAKAAGLRLSNDAVSLAIDPRTGAIGTLRCRGIDSELVDAGKTGLNDYLSRS